MSKHVCSGYFALLWNTLLRRNGTWHSRGDWRTRSPGLYISAPTLCCVAVIALCCISASAGAATTAASEVARPLRSWVAYLQKLRTLAESSAAVRSAQASVRANEALVDAQTGDRDLSLDASYTDYPNGAGTGDNGSFTDLERRGEARLSWGVLDFFARRPGRIASANARVEMAEAGVAYARRDAMQSMVVRSIGEWSAEYQRKALLNATRDLVQAGETLGELHGHTLDSRLSDEVAQADSETLILQSRIAQASSGFPIPSGDLPLPPGAYGALPSTPPALDAIAQVAQQDPQAKELRFESKAFAAQQRAHWADDFRVGVYGGYVTQNVRHQSGSQNGPEVGVEVSVPIGGGGGGMRANAHWQARQQSLAAEDAVHQEELQLKQVLQQWTQASASLQSQVNLIRQQAQQLAYMQQRQAAGASSKAPEPWQLRLAGAQFWLGIADLWRTRAQWVESALVWSLYDEGSFVRSHPRAGGGAGLDTLCAPLPACPQV